MPAIAAVAIPAVASIVGGVIKSRAASKAAKSQEAAAREAIAYQERTQKERQSRYDAAYEDYKKRYDSYLEQFYGVKPQATTQPGVRASSAGMAAGAFGAAPISASVLGASDAPAPTSALGSSAPMVSQVRRGDTIADLLRGIGGIRANAANSSGDVWGNAVTDAGAAVGKGFMGQVPTPQMTIQGEMQPTGVSPAQAGIDPNAFQTGGWSDWDKYLYSGGV